MAAKNRKGKLESFIKQKVAEIIAAGAMIGFEKAKAEAKEVFKQTEKRLYAYPELKNNILKYQRDIVDLESESPGRSKSIAFFRTGGVRLTDEEIQQGRIMLLHGKIHRDQAEIDEIDFALESIKNDEYYAVIELKYFQGQNDEEIAPMIPCDPRTVRRHKNRLIQRIMVKLYGANAVS